MCGENSISPSQCTHCSVANPEHTACEPSSTSFMSQKWSKEKKSVLSLEGGTGSREADRGVRNGWMDGQIKQRQQPLHRGLASHARRHMRGNRFVSEDPKESRQRQSGEEWRWRTLAVRTGAGIELDLISQVSSHYLCLLLSPFCPITLTMEQAPFL